MPSSDVSLLSWLNQKWGDLMLTQPGFCSLQPSQLSSINMQPTGSGNSSARSGEPAAEKKGFWVRPFLFPLSAPNRRIREKPGRDAREIVRPV